MAQESTPKRIFRALDALSPSEVKLSQLPRKVDALYNLKFNEYGQLVKRRGYERYNQSRIENAPVTALHRHYRQGATVKEFLAVCGQKLYRISEEFPHNATLLKEGLASNDVFFTDFYNTCYFVDGSGVYKYDGSEVHTVGVVPPQGAPTGTTQSGGSLSSGTYLVCYTFVDKDGYESNPSPNATFSVSSGQKIVLNIATSPDPKVRKRRVYRTTVNGGIFYLDVEVDDNTTTSVELTRSDFELASRPLLELEHDLPPQNASLITRRRSRLYVASGDSFCISTLAEPEYFPSSLTIYTSARQKITGIAEQGNALVVFTEDTIEALTGYDEESFVFQSAHTPEGCIAPRTIVNVGNILFYLGCDGVYYFDGDTAKLLNTQLAEYLKKNMNYAYAYRSCATYFDNKYLLSYPKGQSQVPNETVYVDLKLGTTGVYSYAFSCYSRWDRGSDYLQLFGGSVNDGFIYRIGESLTDDGAPIVAWDAIEPLDFGIPDTYKQVYDIYIKVSSTDVASLRLFWRLDDAEEQYKDVGISGGCEKWYRITLPGGGQRCRAIAIRPCFTSSCDIIVSGYMFVFRPEVPEWL